MDDFQNEALPVGEAQVAEATQILQRYKAGKAHPGGRAERSRAAGQGDPRHCRPGHF